MGNCCKDERKQEITEQFDYNQNNCGDTYCDTITIDSLGNVYRDAMSGNMGILVSGTPQPNALLSVFASEKEMTDITIVPNPTNVIFSIKG